MSCAFPVGVRRSVSIALIWAGAGTPGCSVFQRDQTVHVPESQPTQLSQTVFDQAILGTQLSSNADQRAMVERVGQRLAQASSQQHRQWQFTLVSSGRGNAVCLPGERVIVDDGLLTYCGNEAGLATAMSHAMAHAIADHGGERLSRMTQEPAGSGLLRRSATARTAPETMFSLAHGLPRGEQTPLPFSQDQNVEADAIAVQMMARAGYDPKEAVRFWEQFESWNRQELPIFAELHPITDSRRKSLDKLMPTAVGYYEQSSKYGLGLAISVPRKKEPIATVSHEVAKGPEKLVKAADASAVTNDPFLLGGATPPTVAAPAATASSDPFSSAGGGGPAAAAATPLAAPVLTTVDSATVAATLVPPALGNVEKAAAFPSSAPADSESPAAAPFSRSLMAAVAAPAEEPAAFPGVNGVVTSSASPVDLPAAFPGVTGVVSPPSMPADRPSAFPASARTSSPAIAAAPSMPASAAPAAAPIAGAPSTTAARPAWSPTPGAADSGARWVAPVAAEVQPAARVPRPTSDLSEAAPPLVDDNWKASRKPAN